MYVKPFLYSYEIPGALYSTSPLMFVFQVEMFILLSAPLHNLAQALGKISALLLHSCRSFIFQTLTPAVVRCFNWLTASAIVTR